MTLTDQISELYKQIIQDVLIDNSQSDLNEATREYAARWSAPVIITTTVRFFEGLFSNKPVQCRKLHNIADSVILFDEAQSLPSHIIINTLKSVNALCERYKCTMVFSTATQPDFDAIPNLSWKPKEIFFENAEAYKKLRRVYVEWRLEKPISLESLADEMNRESCVCAIVNLRYHARHLYQLLKEKGSDKVYYLTTDLCPAHRQQIIRTIKDKMENGEPCRVVATQCIEAGIDLDFCVMYRALAPLDAIIQASGRCNRNGKIPEGGKTVVFIPDVEGRLYPDSDYGEKAEMVRQICCKHKIDICSPDHIKEYYRAILEGTKDSQFLDKAIASRDYSKTEEEYKLIKRGGNHVVIPYEGKAELYHIITGEIKEKGLTKGAIKHAAPITVTTFDRNIEKYCERLYYSQKGKASMELPSDYYLLRPQYLEGGNNLYTDDMGLQFTPKDELISLDKTEFII